MERTPCCLYNMSQHPTSPAATNYQDETQTNSRSWNSHVSLPSVRFRPTLPAIFSEQVVTTRESLEGYKTKDMREMNGTSKNRFILPQPYNDTTALLVSTLFSVCALRACVLIRGSYTASRWRHKAAWHPCAFLHGTAPDKKTPTGHCDIKTN